MFYFYMKLVLGELAAWPSQCGASFLICEKCVWIIYLLYENVHSTV
jgi:hypothetical protein